VGNGTPLARAEAMRLYYFGRAGSHLAPARRHGLEVIDLGLPRDRDLDAALSRIDGHGLVYAHAAGARPVLKLRERGLLTAHRVVLQGPRFGVRDVRRSWRLGGVRGQRIESWWGGRDSQRALRRFLRLQKRLDADWPLRFMPRWGRNPMCADPAAWMDRLAALCDRTTPQARRA
jgi:hypothetical protein